MLNRHALLSPTQTISKPQKQLEMSHEVLVVQIGQHCSESRQSAVTLFSNLSVDLGVYIICINVEPRTAC